MKVDFLKSKNSKHKEEENKIDYEFIDNIQAKTNIIFKENFVKKVMDTKLVSIYILFLQKLENVG